MPPLNPKRICCYLAGVICSLVLGSSSLHAEDAPLVVTPNDTIKATLSKTENVTLTLEEALHIAQEKNPGMLSAKDRVAQAKARYQTRLAEMLPDLKLSFNAPNYKGAVQGFGNNIFIVDRTSYQPELLFKFPIFQGGRKLFPLLAAKKTVSQQENTQEDSHQDLLQQTAGAYYELKRRMADIDAVQKQVAEAQSQLDINKTRMEAGAGTRLDVLQSEAQLAKAQSQLVAAYGAAQTAALTLNELLDLDAFVAVATPDEEQQMQTLIPTNTEMKTLLVYAKGHRPDLLAMQKQIQALKTLRKVVISAVLPEIDLQGRVGAVGPTYPNLKHYDEMSYGITFDFKNLAVPALTTYKENTAQLKELEHTYSTLENAIEREVSTAFIQATTTQQQVTSARVQVEASRLALSDATERLQAGVGRNIDVLDAETKLAEARTSLNSTILEYNQAQVDLVHHLGGASIETLTKGLKLQ